ncbi:MAG: hypothetical protein BGO35_05990 [Burkholderiales bacterium 64-34]|nr:MAG: hypothetical protein BGO35_05990 [Burkholderiales bacterium 64-34]
MAKPVRADRSTTPAAPGQPELDAEFANRLRDPFEQHYMGVLRTNDPLLLERGNGGVELYRDLRRDGKVFSGLQKRQLALVGKPWQVEPRVKESAKGTKDAETLTEILKGIAFDRMCGELLEALLAGFAVSEIVWTVRDGLVVPARVIKRAQRRFVYVQDDENSPARLHLLTRENMLKGVPVPERKFIVHRVNPEDDNPYGTGLGLQLFWPVFFKRKGIVAWNKLCDRFGSPTPHGKYPRNASPKEKGTLADALRAMSNDGYLMTPEGMEIALLESKLSGNVTTQQQLCEYMDDWISEVLTGQEPARSGGGALAAASKERKDVRQDLTQADSDLLSETINETLVAWICEYNGLEPCHVYRNIQEEEDTKTQAEADKLIYDMGFELDENTIRAKYGEGWSKKKAPTPPPVPPQTTATETPPPGPAKLDGEPEEREAEAASFAEPGQPAPVAAAAAALGPATAAVVTAWVRDLRAIVTAHSDPQALQDAVAEAYDGLPTAELVEVMALAFELAHLQGRERAALESSGG